MTTEVSHTTLTKAILRSQHCQRNWDLSQEIPQADLEMLKTAVNSCPSKQNLAYYKAHFITNRDLIEELHDHTQCCPDGHDEMAQVCNSQVLANLLIVFEQVDLTKTITGEDDTNRNKQTEMWLSGDENARRAAMQELRLDAAMAMGIAAGYVNLTASLLGYSTGCCACFRTEDIERIMGINNPVLLMMGVGFKGKELNRRVHHKDHSVTFPTFKKQTIEVAMVA